MTRLQVDGVLVRQRFSQRTAGEVTGYAVAAPGDVNADGQPVWYGGGKLAADLTLPKLRHRWAGADGSVRSPSALRPLDGRHLSWRTRQAVLRTTVRRAADEARTTTEFLDQLQNCGLLLKIRYSQQISGQIEHFLCHAPPGTTIPHLIAIAGMRWKIEENNEHGKDLVGLNEYQVRNWTPWHRHVTTCMLAAAFLAVTAADTATDQGKDPRNQEMPLAR